MVQVQMLFDGIAEKSAKVKDIRAAIKEQLKGSAEYQELEEKAKAIRARKKQIETLIKQDFAGEINKMEDLDIDIESDETMLTDAVMSALMKGETVEVKDQYGNEYEPVFSVKFRKK